MTIRMLTDLTLKDGKTGEDVVLRIGDETDRFSPAEEQEFIQWGMAEPVTGDEPAPPEPPAGQ